MKKLLILALLPTLLSGCGVKNEPPTPISPTASPAPTATATVEYRTLIADEDKELYSYEDMKKDLESLSLAYGDMTSLDVIGESVDGRSIYSLTIGDKNAQNHTIVHASIHAREYINTKLVIKQAAHYLYSLKNSQGSYKGISYTELFNDCAIHLVPMVNPDGVTISQYGLSNIKKEETLQKIREISANDGASPGGSYLVQWKSNANGVDLNRNYDALWEQYVGAANPSSDFYKGTSPGSEPETKALIELTTKYNVKRTISYHTYGQVIYWYFGQEGDLYDVSKRFTDEIAQITGYTPDANYQQLDPAGYKDWALDKLGIPSITIENGYGQNPVPNEQFDNIWERNREVWAGMLYDLKYNNQG